MYSAVISIETILLITCKTIYVVKFTKIKRPKTSEQKEENLSIHKKLAFFLNKMSIHRRHKTFQVFRSLHQPQQETMLNLLTLIVTQTV